MAAAPAQQYYINGKDLYLVFGIAILKGSTNDFLRFADKKDSIEHDWMDSNGIDVDLSRMYRNFERNRFEVPYEVANSFTDYWDKYDKFLAELMLPGLKRFTIAEFERDFYIFYKSCSSPERFTRIKDTTKIIYQFSLTVIEQEPKFDRNNVYLMSDDGKFIVT